MADEMRSYVVRQGDYLTKLAFVHGFDVEEVWNDPANRDLKELRRDHNILAPGDVLQIPLKPKNGLPFTRGTTNRYTAMVPRVSLHLHFQSSCGRFANAKFAIEGGATPTEGITDGEGRVELSVAVHAAEVQVVFPELDRRFTVLVGGMDPVTEISGVKARLAQLGYLLANPCELFGVPPPGESEIDPDNYNDAWLAAAVQAFQTANELSPTGVIDDATRAALVRVHGS